MANLTVDKAEVALVRTGYNEVETAPAGEAIDAGAPVRYDANGYFVKAAADTAPHANDVLVAYESANQAGITISAVRRGTIDLGKAPLAARAFGDAIYLSDTAGALADAAGTVTKVIGHVRPAHGEIPAAKLLRVEL